MVTMAWNLRLKSCAAPVIVKKCSWTSVVVNQRRWNAEAAMNTRTTVIIGVLGAVTLCNANLTHAAPSDDACSLLSQAQVDAALGAPVTVVKAGSDAKHCHWQLEGKRGETIVEAHLMLEAAKSYDTAKNTMGMSGKVTRVSISDVGDDAYYLVGGRDAPLFVKKGNAGFRIAVNGKGWRAEEIKAKEKALALALLAKL